MIIEFIGTPGAGKTTLMREAAKLLEERALRPRTVVDAARPFAERTAWGKVVRRLTPRSWHRPLLWQVFYVLSVLHRIKFCARHSALVRLVLGTQLRRPASANVRGRRVLHWFFRLTGAYEFLKTQARSGDVLLLDEGFLHRVVQTHASDAEVPDVSQVLAYVDLLPAPDLVIFVKTPRIVCEERIFHRGLWKHFQQKSREQVSRFLANAETVVELAVSRAKSNGWRVIEVDNGADNLAASTAVLRNKLASVLSPLRSVPEDQMSPQLSGTSAPSALRILCFPRPSRLTAYLNSRWRPLDIPADTIREILRHYGLDQTGPAHNLPMSRRTRNVVVNTSAGKKVLKLYRRKWQADTILYAHSILERLADRNFPAPRLVLTPGGQSFSGLVGRNYALFDFVDGANYSSGFLPRAHRLKLKAIAGRTLARFHRELAGFVPQGQHHLGFHSFTADRHHDLAWHTHKVIELKERSRTVTGAADAVHIEWLLGASDSILEELSRLDQDLRRAPLPRVVIHGDYGLHNLLFQPNGTATPVDFESARLEWRLSDLVGTLSRLRSRSGAYDLERMRCFLQGYQSESPLTPEERDLLPSVWRFRKLQSVLQYWNSYFETGGLSQKLLAARSAMEQARWGLHNSEKLLALIPISSMPGELRLGDLDKTQVRSLA